MRYEEKVTIITGGSRGIGEGCARVFTGAGSNVVIASCEVAQGMALAEALNVAGGGSATFIKCDVTSASDLENLVAETMQLFGRIDCLINNAGWHPPHLPIENFSDDDFRQLLELNVISIFNACRLALPHLRVSRGNIINMSSLVAQIGQLHATTYVATKGAVTSFTKALAIDEAANHVRVNSVSPGNIDTPLWKEAIDAAPDPQKCRADGDAAQLMGRMGSTEEVGRMCLFIASEATFTTGVDHIVSCGAELGYGRKSRMGAGQSGE